MKTFYIASSSAEPKRLRVSQLAKALHQKFGWKWQNGYDWTVGFQEECNYPRHELVYRATMDLLGARDCDVFIFLEGDERSLGANREYGVRWGQQRKMIYRVSNEREHLFDMLDNVATVETDEELMILLLERETL